MVRIFGFHPEDTGSSPVRGGLFLPLPNTSYREKGLNYFYYSDNLSESLTLAAALLFLLALPVAHFGVPLLLDSYIDIRVEICVAFHLQHPRALVLPGRLGQVDCHLLLIKNVCD